MHRPHAAPQLSANLHSKRPSASVEDCDDDDDEFEDSYVHAPDSDRDHNRQTQTNHHPIIDGMFVF